MAMSSNATTFLHHLTAFLLLLLLLFLQVGHGSAGSCFSAIFSFGDSLQDTGNFIHTYANTTVSKLPWGETFFHQATGRFSNGRVILDFIAEAVGLPFVPPYRGGGDFSRGANFAFAGATALGPSEVTKYGINSTGWSDHSLLVQLREFMQLLQSTPSLKSRTFLGKSLIVMGEIGGNEYNAALSQNMPLDTIKAIVPPVVQRISFAITFLVKFGAKNFIVPGNLPIGCIPAWLGYYHSSNPKDYDANGCINWLNDFSQYHNNYLINELNRLKGVHPGVTIQYADYYGSGMRMFSNQKQFGITVPFTACCGGNGHGCDETGPVCSNPQNYASWEGFHPAEATYSAISDGLIRGPFAIPFLSQKC